MKTQKENELSLELLLASIYYLMTRYAKAPDAKISSAISDHLVMLSSHPNCNSEILQKVGSRLAIQWREHLHNQDNKITDCNELLTQPLQHNFH